MTTHNYNRTSVCESLIFMPDISGYTRFVHETDIKFGKEIIYELLLKILENNILNLEVIEIEGDAILFHRKGDPPSLNALFAQYEAMLTAFKIKLRELDKRYHLEQFELSLKLIVHFGAIAEYNLSGFHKLYGDSINEAHVLLKNNVPDSNYILITESAKNKISGWHTEIAALSEWISEEFRSFVKAGSETLRYSYFLYDAVKFKEHVLKTNKF
jgi:hypothetical protein